MTHFTPFNFRTLIFAIIVTSLFSACTKEPTHTAESLNIGISEGKSTYQMLHFVDQNELFNTLQEIDTVTDLTAYESLKGYSSIGRLADDYFSTINANSFSTADELVDDMNLHSQYVEIEIEPDGVTSFVPKFFHNRLRYVANQDGVFRVADTLVRLFTSGMVYTTADNLTALLALNENDLNSISANQNLHFDPYPVKTYIETTTRNTHQSPTIRSDDNCIAININVIYYSQNNSGNMRIYSNFEYSWISSSAPFMFGITSYCKTKILGIWVAAKRNIEYHGNIVYHLHDYLGGIGPTAYADDCTEYSETINIAPENKFYVRCGLCQPFTYKPTENRFFFWICGYTPKWYDILRFKSINLNVHAASVEQTISVFYPLL